MTEMSGKAAYLPPGSVKARAENPRAKGWMDKVKNSAPTEAGAG